jgi:hypothetical protein
MNAGDKDIEVSIEHDWSCAPHVVLLCSPRVVSDSQRVVTGLSFHGTYRGREVHAVIIVADGSCHYRFAVPDLDPEPWKSLIGESIKFRWLGGRRMVAYPPTPDVQKPYSPERASTDDEARTIRPVETTCG